MELHPIMYVPDQYAEREFYRLFGFETVYEGAEFPGFLALQHGAATIGLQRAGEGHPAYANGLRWQFEVASEAELDAVVDACREHGLGHEIEVEEGGSRFRTRLVRVTSPAGVTVFFEGPNERS